MPLLRGFTLDLHIIEAPISAGSPTTGAERAFQDLRAHGLPQDFSAHAVTWIPMEHPAPSPQGSARMKHLGEVQTVCRGVRARTLEALEAGAFPLILGGDHSIGMGSIAALGEHFGPQHLSVVWIDAHTDINTQDSSPSGYLHGMPLAASMGLCAPELQMGREKVNLLGSHTYILGARSIDPPEYPILRAQKVNLYTADRLCRDGVGAVMEDVRFRMRDTAIHISLDVDCFDPTVLTATGYVIDHGLMLTQVQEMLRVLFATGRVVSFELVEYNPSLDSDGRGRQVVLDLLSQVARSLPR